MFESIWILCQYKFRSIFNRINPNLELIVFGSLVFVWLNMFRFGIWIFLTGSTSQFSFLPALEDMVGIIWITPISIFFTFCLVAGVVRLLKGLP